MNALRQCWNFRIPISQSLNISGVNQPALRSQQLLSMPAVFQQLPSPAVFNLSCRQLTCTPVLAEKKIAIGKKVSRSFLRDLENDTSFNEVASVDALQQVEDEPKEEFSVFPDADTPEQLFNGVKFKDLPVVTLLLHKNNTKLYARHADDRMIYENSPSMHGFINAKKRTKVAGQVAGLNMGQKLRSYGIKSIRVRVSGFNQARISTLQGIVQAGVEIVAIADITHIDWGWAKRAKARPSKN